MSLGRNIAVLVLLILFPLFQEAGAQRALYDQQYRITYLTSDEGLSQNTIDCIFKDSRGFMWFGTWNGLNRYDGYNFKVYKREEYTNSISNNFIHALCEDLEGNLWIGTRNGLNFFDFKHDRIDVFFSDSSDTRSMAENWINTVFCDNKGILWAGTNGSGLRRVKKNEDGEFLFEQIRATDTANLRLGSDLINSIEQDSKGRMWIGTSNGLSLFDPREDKTLIFANDPEDPGSISSSEILCTFEDHEGNIWIGTEYGLNRWEERTNRFVRYLSRVSDPRSLAHAEVTAMGEDPEGRLYIATLGGLDIYDKATDDFGHIPVEGYKNFSLNNEFINSIYCDNSGLVWVGTEKGGINKFNIYQKQFRYISTETPGGIRLNENTVNSILPEEDILWVGTAGGGLNMIDLVQNKVRYFSFNSEQTSSIGNDFITSLCRDRNDNLWIGTWGGGFSKLISAANNGRFEYYRHDPEDPNSLINNFVSGIYEDRDGNIWVGTEEGLDIFDPETSSFTHILNEPEEGEPITDVGCILEDYSGYLWIGTRKGLFCLTSEHLQQLKKDPNSTKALHFRSRPEDIHSLNENYIICLYEDRRRNLWIGTYGNGLNKLEWDRNHPDSVKFRHYTQKQGLSNNVVYGILEDEKGFLWLSTDYGLSRFNPVSIDFSNYFVADGLQSNQFYWSACAKGRDGTLYFGGMDGVNYFKAEQIINNTNYPAPVLTDLKILNNSIEPGQAYGKRIILEEAISETPEIHLSYKENTFSLEFSSLNYDLPEKNKYAYRLEGVDENWVIVGSDRRFANYTKLPGGDYTFYLRAANNDGLWNDDPLKVHIIIKPPFWKTGWFRALLVLVILLLIGLYLRLHTRSLQLQKKKLEKQVQERTAQIELQKKQLEVQNTEILEQRDRLLHLNKKVMAANQLKLKFFTNISHEFRTPLTLILGPLEKLKSNWEIQGEARQLLSLITRNAERLLHLITQLMDFRKIEKGKMDLHVQLGNLDVFIREILEAFQEPVEQKSIKLNYLCHDDVSAVWFDHEKLENVLYNLLSNALKYTADEGNINVFVNTERQRNGNRKENTNKNKSEPLWVKIELQDNGIGISPEKLPNIFKRFYQAEQNTDSNIGSGIGLSLTKDLVKVHKGHIRVDSSLGKGTQFTLEIPCEKCSYSAGEITDTKLTKSNLTSHVEMLKNILEAEREKAFQNEALYLRKHVNKPGLLIVEDNRELREFVASRLNRNYNILMAENGKEALQKAEDHNPDLIISDIMMPVMDGLQFCSKIKQQIQTSHIPLILLTAKGTVENQIEGYKIGADDYIPKPFSLDLLETRVENLIESRKQLRSLFSKEREINMDEITDNPMDQKFLKQALEHIEENLANSDFNVNDFASGMCVSRSLLHKKLTALTDQSATDFINTVRLKKSKELMLSGSYNISEIAYAVGYNDPKYYSRLFKRQFGISPSEFIKELRTKVG